MSVKKCAYVIICLVIKKSSITKTMILEQVILVD